MLYQSSRCFLSTQLFDFFDEGLLAKQYNYSLSIGSVASLPILSGIFYMHPTMMQFQRFLNFHEER